MTEAGILTAVGLILSVAMAFCGGAWAYVNSHQERERKRDQEADQEQFRRIRELEDDAKELRYWLRKQGIRTSRQDEPSPPEKRLAGGSA